MTSVPRGPSVPRYRPRSASLEALLPRHYEFVYELVTHPDVSWRWRYRGEVPSFEQVIRQLWDGVVVQRLIINRPTGPLCGSVRR